LIERYRERARAHAAARDAELQRSARVARMRLATFIPGAALVVWSLTRGAPALPMAAGIGLLAVFAILVVVHARIEERAAWFDALHVVNLQGVARIERDWNALPIAEAPAIDHPYANDLDLFGRASLTEWLGPAATPAGAATLQRWLLAPAAPDAVRARQVAVNELADADEWRETLAAHGRLAAAVRGVELASFLKWAEGPGAFPDARRRALHAVVLVLTASIWILAAMHAAGLTQGAYWLTPLVAGAVLSFATSGRVHGQFDRAGAGQQAFSRYAALFEHAVAAPSAAPCLASVRNRLSAAGDPAPACMRRLNRIMGFAQLRSGAAILHFPIQAATLWDFHVLFALDRWRTTAGGRVRGWMDALGELDALSAFARVRADNPAWAMPEVSESLETLSATNLGHPLIDDARRVGNDIDVGPAGSLVLITGSNMSGKSTLLRAVGLNAVLAQAGCPVCASSLKMPAVILETSIRVQDSLERGQSYFMAALARLKGVVTRSQEIGEGGGRVRVLYLLDEILQGTNTAERAVAVRGVARHLLQAGAIGVMTTHDLSLAAEEPFKSAARLVHFTETVTPSGGMTFDYRLRPGLATSRNALRLMQLMGIDVAPD
jgi:hypothetical protein